MFLYQSRKSTAGTNIIKSVTAMNAMQQLRQWLVTPALDKSLADELNTYSFKVEIMVNLTGFLWEKKKKQKQNTNQKENNKYTEIIVNSFNTFFNCPLKKTLITLINHK